MALCLGDLVANELIRLKKGLFGYGCEVVTSAFVLESRGRVNGESLRDLWEEAWLRQSREPCSQQVPAPLAAQSPPGQGTDQWIGQKDSRLHHLPPLRKSHQDGLSFFPPVFGVFPRPAFSTALPGAKIPSDEGTPGSPDHLSRRI